LVGMEATYLTHNNAITLDVHVIYKTEEARLLNNIRSVVIRYLVLVDMAAMYLANTRVTDEGQQTKGDKHQNC
jgi:hypothetical protein